MQFNTRFRAGSARIAGGAVMALLTALALGPVACSKTADTPGASAAAHGESVPAPEAATAEAPEQAPDVAVVTPAELLDIVRAHHDKVVVVKFWATWCAPCVEELPKVVAFYEKHRDSGSLAFVSVSADLTDSINDTVIPFLKEKAVPFPVRVIDAAGPDAIVSGLGVEESAWEGTLPATFIFDKEGRLNRFWLGAVPEGALEEAVTALS
ncbi:MAG TPA: TlpA family protein disulfide reductase [Candidatus Hydrogenedentes bacterium]|jgi:thiol-disulfide isomerase/thioredoxin|nr:TlpA family protein disulfide reductase [FCB group bacterium]HNZ18756.1 TlpA family protein disulfide reductase [Candidatus Hydrogenedentota bacterium]